jgi:NAD(P)-dependent dehydrogenase (short-subunit alcohol dehydrogenase family)
MNETRKSIFITGAASGIGKATALLFAEKGWYVGAVDLNEKGLNALLDEIGEDNCFIHVLDVSDKTAFEQVLEKFGQHTSGKLDLLFNNAGIGVFGNFDEVPYKDHISVIQVNLIGVVNGIYTALPMLKATENSLCFTTSSSAATYGSPGLAIYGATKHAVKGLTEALSVEFARFNVRAADVLPLIIQTNIWDDSPMYAEGQKVEREKDWIQASSATEGMARLLPPSEVAEVVWKAYSSEQLHWYVPEELRRVDIAKGENPEMVRERYKAGNPFSSFD